MIRTISLFEAAKLLGIGKNEVPELAASQTFPVPVRNIAGKSRVLWTDVTHLIGTTETLTS